MITTAPITVGKCSGFTFIAAICSSFMGISDAPKSTVPLVSWLIPAPEPPPP